MKSSKDIRQQFIDYFARHGHSVVESSPLIPQNDPTLLFTNAGMVQFKDVFLGSEQRPYSRATSSQKCMRAGGKHNDLENVGHTARHHTFFEMLGNFSFGDYFKRDAINLAWEFMTGVLGLPAERLWVTVFEEDDEAHGLWSAVPGVMSERIVRMGAKDNFWSMGDTGPCGPCSEILIDQGPEFSCGRPDCRAGCDCDRYLELWNLVFMQYDRDGQGTLSPLPRPSIDTGMGLERVCAVLQNAKSNYDTDLFQPLIGMVENMCGRAYGSDAGHDMSMRVIADHSRAATFLIADGVLPSNEGRGYVLRRIMRRAARRGRLLGIEQPFLHETAAGVADQMGNVYPEVRRSLDFIQKAILNEERSFSQTLAAGLKILEDEMRALKQRPESTLPGETVFRLYDTYGFPPDLTRDIVREQDLKIDEHGFERAMQNQRERARRAWKGSGEQKIAEVYRRAAEEAGPTVFHGYDTHSVETRIVKLLRGGSFADEAAEGDEVEIITAETPFYGESGGQVGDTGHAEGDGYTLSIRAAAKPLEGLIVHRAAVTRGRVRSGDAVRLYVDTQTRLTTAANHTATHILHAVLRSHLGPHVKQAGSLVSPERLRFDFTHFEGLSRDDIRAVEDAVNERIRENTPLSVDVLSRDEAVERGATALFGEKYGDEVRVVGIGDYSMELCGGTHTQATGDIGLFKIVGESAVAAGVRRIEAVTGESACRLVRQQEELLDSLAGMLKTESGGIAGRIERLLASQKEMEKEIERLNARLLSGQAGSVLDRVREVGGIKVLPVRLDDRDPKSLRSYGDQLRDRLGSGIVVIGAAHGGKAHLLVMVSDDLTGKISAGEIIRETAPLLGGKGGGRPDMAQAGGRDADRLDEALDRAVALVRETVSVSG